MGLFSRPASPGGVCILYLYEYCTVELYCCTVLQSAVSYTYCTRGPSCLAVHLYTALLMRLLTAEDKARHLEQRLVRQEQGRAAAVAKMQALLAPAREH